MAKSKVEEYLTTAVVADMLGVKVTALHRRIIAKGLLEPAGKSGSTFVFEDGKVRDFVKTWKGVPKTKPVLIEGDTPPCPACKGKSLRNGTDARGVPRLRCANKKCGKTWAWPGKGPVKKATE